MKGLWWEAVSSRCWCDELSHQKGVLKGLVVQPWFPEQVAEVASRGGAGAAWRWSAEEAGGGRLDTYILYVAHTRWRSCCGAAPGGPKKAGAQL